MARKVRTKSTAIETVKPVRRKETQTGAASAGQSGDLQGLTDREDVDSESVVELIEEGQSYEASLVDGIENAPLPDEGALRARHRREDDVPLEYVDRPSDEPKE
jgi:hypothetical protein